MSDKWKAVKDQMGNPDFWLSNTNQQMTTLNSDPDFAAMDDASKAEVLNYFRLQSEIGSPSDEEVSTLSKADRFRYGFSIGGGLLLGPLGAGASVAIRAALVGGEAAFSALGEYLARGEEDPEATEAERIAEGAKAGAIDIATLGLFKPLKAVSKRVGKMLGVPKTIGAAEKTTQRLLAEAAPEGRGILKSKPFSISFGRLNKEAQNFVVWLESIARSSIGGRKIMQAFDDRNEKALSDLFGTFMDQRARETSGKEFGDFTKKLLGAWPDEGELFEPVMAWKSFLWTQAEESIKRSGSTVDATSLLSHFRGRSGDIKIKKILTRLKGLNLLPQMKGEGAEAAWKNLDAWNARKLVREMGDLITDTDPAFDKVVKFARGKLDGILEKSLPAEAKKLYKGVKKYQKEVISDVFYNDTIKNLRKTLRNKPSTILQNLPWQDGRLDTLLSFKEALYKSAAAPSTSGVKIIADNYEDVVLKPIRHAIVSPAIDRQTKMLIPDKLIGNLDRLRKHGDEYLNEVWGEDNWRRLYDLATAIKTNALSYGDSVFIQLAQAGAIGATIQRSTKGAFTILLGPYLLSKVLSKPTLVRALTDGITAGPKSRAMMKEMRKIVNVQASAETDLKEMSRGAFEYFTTDPNEEISTENAPPTYENQIQSLLTAP